MSNPQLQELLENPDKVEQAQLQVKAFDVACLAQSYAKLLAFSNGALHGERMAALNNIYRGARNETAKL